MPIGIDSYSSPTIYVHARIPSSELSEEPSTPLSLCIECEPAHEMMSSHIKPMLSVLGKQPTCFTSVFGETEPKDFGYNNSDQVLGIHPGISQEKVVLKEIKVHKINENQFNLEKVYGNEKGLDTNYNSGIPNGTSDSDIDTPSTNTPIIQEASPLIPNSELDLEETEKMLNSNLTICDNTVYNYQHQEGLNTISSRLTLIF